MTKFTFIFHLGGNLLHAVTYHCSFIHSFFFFFHLFILIVYLLELDELNCEWHGFYWKDILFKIIQGGSWEKSVKTPI